MNEQLKKLENVKKSCKGVKTVAFVLFIMTLVATLITLVTGIVFASTNGKYDDGLKQGFDKGYISVEQFHGFISITTDGETVISNIKSDVPALQDTLSNASISFVFGLYCMIISIICGLVAIPCYFFYSAFNSILKEESPFTDVVIKKFLICFIVITVIILLTTSTGFAILSAFFTWAIYSILDYGRTLQIQSDETL